MRLPLTDSAFTVELGRDLHPPGRCWRDPRCGGSGLWFPLGRGVVRELRSSGHPNARRLPASGPERERARGHPGSPHGLPSRGGRLHHVARRKLRRVQGQCAGRRRRLRGRHARREPTAQRARVRDCPVAQRRCSPSCSSRTAGRAALARSSLTSSVRRVPRMARLPRVCRVLPGRPRLPAAGLRVWRVRRIRTLSLVPLSATAGNPLHTAPTDIHPLRAHTHARAHAHARIHTSGTPIYISTTTHPTPQHAHPTHAHTNLHIHHHTPPPSTHT